jgi:hypothetical protein
MASQAERGVTGLLCAATWATAHSLTTAQRVNHQEASCEPVRQKGTAQAHQQRRKTKQQRGKDA